MKARKEVQEVVLNKIHEITDGNSEFVDSHTSDDQFIELIEHFLPLIDETPDGQHLADMLFISRSFSSIEDDEILDSIKTSLGILDAPNSKEYVEKAKKAISKDIADYKKRRIG